MRMCLEPSTSRNVIIIQHAECAKMHPFWVVPTGKTEGMVCVEPAVIGVASGVRCVVNVLRCGIGHAGARLLRRRAAPQQGEDLEDQRDQDV
jgi:hypothetical protein